MAVSISDKAMAARVLHEAVRMPVADIADMFSVDKATVYRWLERAKEESPPEHSAVADLDALLATQELEEVGRMNAGIARQLASKLDSACASDKAQDSMAVPALAKELRSVVDTIMGASTDDKEWLADVFSKVGIVPNPGA